MIKNKTSYIVTIDKKTFYLKSVIIKYEKDGEEIDVLTYELN